MKENTLETPPEHIRERINKEAIEYETRIFDEIIKKGVDTDYQLITKLRHEIRNLHKKKATEKYFDSKRSTEAQQELLKNIDALKKQIR